MTAAELHELVRDCPLDAHSKRKFQEILKVQSLHAVPADG